MISTDLVRRAAVVLAAWAAAEAAVALSGVLIPREFSDRRRVLFGLMEPDPTIGFRTRLNLRDFRVSWFETEVEASYSTDDEGFRNVGRDPIEARVAFVGDSFTWGSWVERGKIFPDRLERELGIPVVNLGRPSYFLEQYEILIERALERRRLDVVVLCVFANDLAVPLSADDLARFYERFGWSRYERYPFAKRLLSYNLAAWAERLFTPPATPWHLETKRTRDGLTLYRADGAHPYYFSENYAENAERVFERILRLILERGARPLVALLPSKESARAADYVALFGGEYLRIEEEGYRRLAEIASGLDVPTIDLTAAFRNASETAYFDRDPHWNEAGHRLAAETLAPALREVIEGAGSARRP